MTTSGYLVVVRSRDTKGIYVETTDDWEEYANAETRMIYCQAVADIEVVQEKIDVWLKENEYLKNRHDDVNEAIAEIVSSVQWIANEHPLQGFRPVNGNDLFKDMDGSR